MKVGGGLLLLLLVALLVVYAPSSTSTRRRPTQSTRILVLASDNQHYLQQRHVSDSMRHFWVPSMEERADFLQQEGPACAKALRMDFAEFWQSYDSTAPSSFLFQYCALYQSTVNVVWNADETNLLVEWDDLISTTTPTGVRLHERAVYPGLVSLGSKGNRQLCIEVMRLFVQSGRRPLGGTPDVARALAQHLPNTTTWWRADCAGFTTSLEQPTAMQCPIHGPCCQIAHPHGQIVATIAQPPATAASIRDDMFRDGKRSAELVSVEKDETAYMAHVEVVAHPAELASDAMRKSSDEPLSNFFDIMLENDCLPESRSCYRCLKKELSCENCLEECRCYCKALCRIRPPTKPVTETWHVHLPTHVQDPSRLVPRTVHQTWKENVTQYPNLSRLAQSLSSSGWDYRFYTDDDAHQFLREHFPPPVIEAYEALLPGAFRADLFRYCVLLIHGGVYADMDVLLESNLDALLSGVNNDVGFVTAQDEPGTDEDHRCCLWNGFLVAAPGHPFLVHTIEQVVNNVRHRFTSVDYDDMLCLRPVVSVTHRFDMLYTTGPCILGATINQVLQRHPQTSFQAGELDLYETGDAPDDSDDLRRWIPGRSVVLEQNKNDMGAHRFTWRERNLIVAGTDFPDADDLPKTLDHYSKTHAKYGVYGVNRLYKDAIKTNERIRIKIVH